MNSRFTSLILAVVLVGCAAATLAYLSRDGPSRPATTVLSPGAAERLQRLEDSLEALSAKADTMAHQLVPGIHTSGEAGFLPGNGARNDGVELLLGHLAALEGSMNELKEAVEQLHPPSNKPTTEDFASTDGYVFADDFFAKEEYGQAAKGYETFLEHHADRPDARKLLEKLREAYSKTGDPEKAIAAQEDLIRRYPQEAGYADYMLLARMKRDLGSVAEAVADAEQAIARASDLETQVNGHMTRAWFVEERDGSEAGLHAYREIERLILERGWRESPFLGPCRKNIARIAEKVASRRDGE